MTKALTDRIRVELSVFLTINTPSSFLGFVFLFFTFAWKSFFVSFYS